MDSTPEADTGLQRRIRDQEVVAELGRRALEIDDLDRLLAETAATVAETLETEYATVLEARPTDGVAVLREGAGWPADLVGSATVPLESDCRPAAALRSAESVVVDARETEGEFSRPQLLAARDVDGGISTRIGSDDEPWGVLGVHATEQRAFTDADAAFVRQVAETLAAAVDELTTKRRLRERERQLSTLMSNIPGMVYRSENEPGWPVAFVSDGARELTGYEPETIESVEVHWGEEIMVDDHRDVWTEIRTAVDDRDPFNVTYRIETASGNRRWVTDYGRGIYEHGELVAIEGVVFDVTERERLRTELEELYGRVTDGFLALDDDWTFTHVNDRAAEILGVDADDLQGRTIWDAFPDLAGTEFEANYREAMATQEPISFEAYYEPDDRWFEERVYPSETGLSVYVRDVTERKERERDLELFRTLLDHSNDSVLVIDPETGRYLDANETACRRRGYSREELLDSTVPDLETEFDGHEDWTAFVEELREAGRLTFDGEHRRKDGTTYPVELNVSYVELDRSYVLAVARDVTERRERERRLEESNERLEQFAYAASHDLREPLRMVSSYLQLLERRYADELDEDGEEFIEYAVDGAERMREMIDGLLEYSRVDTQGAPLEPVDLDDVLAAVRENLQVKVEETDAEITAESLPRVRGDENQLRQVLQNLLANAIEYSGEAPPRIHVSADRGGPRSDPNRSATGVAHDGETWTISVVDEGIGIEPDDGERVFEVFQRLHGREEHSGTGIGLALCRRIVERHGGEIWVDSEPGEGATFSFTLPAAREGDGEGAGERGGETAA